uniref:Uncharacterized protein n=1 Tax=Cannabis sativa TaxID=3483 RepID=A0A803NIU8_CANSA
MAQSQYGSGFILGPRKVPKSLGNLWPSLPKPDLVMVKNPMRMGATGQVGRLYPRHPLHSLLVKVVDGPHTSYVVSLMSVVGFQQLVFLLQAPDLKLGLSKFGKNGVIGIMQVIVVSLAWAKAKASTLLHDAQVSMGSFEALLATQSKSLDRNGVASLPTLGARRFSKASTSTVSPTGVKA